MNAPTRPHSSSEQDNEAHGRLACIVILPAGGANTHCQKGQKGQDNSLASPPPIRSILLQKSSTLGPEMLQSRAFCTKFDRLNSFIAPLHRQTLGKTLDSINTWLGLATCAEVRPCTHLRTGSSPTPISIACTPSAIPALAVPAPHQPHGYPLVLHSISTLVPNPQSTCTHSMPLIPRTCTSLRPRHDPRPRCPCLRFTEIQPPLIR